MGIKTKQIAPEPRLVNVPASNPAINAGQGSFFPIAGTTETEAAFMNSAGVVIQLTQDGTINAERNTIVSVGSGESLYKEKVGAALHIRSLKAGTNININNLGDELEISSVDTGEVNTGSNEGTGIGTYVGKTGANLRFRSIKAGPNVIVSESAGDIIIEAAGDGGGSSGEANDAVNLGAVGARVFAQKNGVTLEFRRLVAGSGMVINENANDIELVATSGIGEANTASNIGSGTGEVYKQKTGSNLEMRRLQAGAGISIVTNTNEIVVTNTGGGGGGEANTASNVGTGVGVFKQKSLVDLEFHKIKAGTGINVVLSGDDVVVENTASGEVNTASSVGSGEASVFKDKSGVDLRFRSIKQGSGIQVSQNADDVTITATGGGGVVSGEITIPTGADLAARIAGASGLPVGWSLYLGNNVNVDAGLQAMLGVDAANSLVLAHGQGKVGIFKVLSDVASTVYQQQNFDPASGEMFESTNLNQIAFKNFDTKTSGAAAKLMAAFF